MHNVAAYGYPTPPASPSYDNTKCAFQQPPVAAAPPCQTRYTPVAPEERLGKFLGDSLQLVVIIGTGAYGVVYLAVDVKTGVHYAVKTLSKFNPDGTPLDRRQIAFQHRELRLHYLASAHPNVVSMHKIVDDPDCIYVVLEYCPEGDLFLNITERGQYVGKDDLAKSVFLQILDAVEHCHSLGIYHRDLKPENILVLNQGDTVKLADFGLATSSDRSEDYGCGSTFYMSPECLDPSSRRPFYYCAPNDVWSLGVILVNLTCGRNPWKQASFEDSTYRAYTRSQDFLRTILPLSDELNNILGRIFTRNPDHRITLPELRSSILACSQFTMPAVPAPIQALPTPPCSPGPIEYVQCDDVIIEESAYDAPQSPATLDSDTESTCSSDDGSLISSVSTIDDLDEDDFVIPEDEMPPIEEPQMFDSEEHRVMFPPEFIPQYSGAAVEPCQPCRPCPVPVPLQAPCAPTKFAFPYFWEMVNRYTQPAPILHHPLPFHPQVPLFSHFQGCY
ncbi:Ran1-like protein kinase [Durotheca rogersii]|uniref:Ran1-like protein kinase n=1 Tax=Durotheca rogersii TaxID=419775 RepID=UPI0022204740|nr:Ran1-like protein kinase [Durotheca rogersii]KAI5866424.1 Ran1-like protein kinase [Durotheca rogersii]